jgi:hypothetical protein
MPTARLSVTLNTTNWTRFNAADFVPMSGGTVAAGRVFSSVTPITVDTNNCSFFLGDRVGNADGGTRGLIIVPPVEDFPQLAGATLTFGNAVVRFRHVNGTSASTTVDTLGKTRAQIVTELVALLTAATTGIGDLEVAAGDEPGAVVFQSDASDTTTIAWAQTGGPRCPLHAEGMVAATAEVLDAAATAYASRVADGSEVWRSISLRAAAANSVVVIEAEIGGGKVGR